MQSSTNGILVTRQGTRDDMSLDVSIRRGTLAFSTQVYVNELQLCSEAAKLGLALEQVFDAPAPLDVVLSFGPKALHSPSFEMAIQSDKLGHVRIVVTMVATFMEMACTINLISDLASLDSFAAQLSSLSKSEDPIAQFSAE
jgi:hypothetical protein